MSDSRFVYVTYIRTTPEKLWHALLDPEFTRQFWVGTWQECQWKIGASWKIMTPDGRVADAGEVVEIDPPRKLVLSWRNEFKPELREEGYSRMTYTLEPQGETVKLTSCTRSPNPTRSSSTPCRTVGRTSSPASRACWRRVSPSWQRAPGPKRSESGKKRRPARDSLYA